MSTTVMNETSGRKFKDEQLFTPKDAEQAMSCANFLSRNGGGLTGTVSSLLSFFGDKVGSCFWIGRVGAELALVTLRIQSRVIRPST